MHIEDNNLAISGKRFFGKMSASATHEIKNTLSIINENAGLLEDLSQLSKEGSPLMPDRIHTISQTIKRQVLRTDKILNNLNRFSHSVDQNTEQVDLEKTIDFILELSARLTQMMGITIRLDPYATTIVITTDLFYFQNMIWQAIETTCSLFSEIKQLIISFNTEDKKIKINFSFDKTGTNMLNSLFNKKEDKALITYLGINIEQNKDGFSLLLPKRI